MTQVPFALLNLIGAAGRLIAGPQRSAAPITGPDFDALLKQAADAEFSSGRTVTISPRADLQLTPEQLQRVSLAADRAEANGAGKALILIDGLALKVDVVSRTIEQAVDSGAQAVLTDIDAVLGAPGEHSTGAPTAFGPTAPPSNPSILQLLADAGH
jgi:hypothetical protein